MRFLYTILLSLICLSVAGQTYVTKDTTFTVSGNIYRARISYLAGTADSTEAVLFMPGAGEAGNNDDPSQLVVVGPHKFIAAGWNGVVDLGNGAHRPVWITLRQRQTSQTAGLMNELLSIMESCRTRFKIKAKGFHATGMSNGFQQIGTLCTYIPSAGDFRAVRMFSSVVDVLGQGPVTTLGATLAYPQKLGYTAKNFGLKFFGIQQTQDGTSEQNKIVINMNDSMPGSANLVYTTFGAANHCCWDEYYNPAANNWTLSNPEVQQRKPNNSSGFYSIPIAGNQNIYQWMLRQGDTTLPGGNKPPVANAGADKFITLPTNNVSLVGSESDPDGSVASRTWTQISGPNTATIVSAGSISTTVTGLVAGTYVFRLTVTDNLGVQNYDDVSVTVSPAYVNQPPIAIAPDRSVNLPASYTLLDARLSTDDNAITSYSWEFISGPNTPNILHPTGDTSTITGLIQGIYQIKLTVTDGDGLTDDLIIEIIVNPENSYATVNVNGYFVGSSANIANSVNLPSWNAIIIPTTSATNITSQALNYETGSPSGIVAILSANGSVNDNTSTYANNSTVSPAKIHRYGGSYSGGVSRTFTLSNLPLNATYDLEFFSSRLFTPEGAGTTFTIGGVSKGVMSAQNLDSTIKFTGLVPDVSGNIVATLTRFYPSTSTYLNGFILTEIHTDGGNILPNVTTSGDQRFRLPTNSATITAIASDPDGTISTYLWEKISGGTVTMGTVNASSFNPTNLVKGTYVFKVTVTDNDGGQSSSDVTIKVLSQTNEPPVVSAGSDITVQKFSTTLLGTATDEDGVIVSTLWTQLTGTSTTSIVNTSSLSTPANGFVIAGDYTFELRATDDSSATVRDTVKVTILENTSLDCRANAGNDQVIDKNTSQAVLDGTGSTGENLSYSWRKITVTDFGWKGSLNSQGRSVAYAKIFPYRDGAYQYELTVTNGLGCTDKDTVDIYKQYGTPAPQSTDALGWHYATAADVTAINAMGNPGLAREGDVVINGARASSFSGIGYVDINFTAANSPTLPAGGRVLIRAGNYRQINLRFGQNMVVGTAANPIIITNYGGQVEATYVLVTDCINAKITGKYVAGVSGHPSYLGHANGHKPFINGSYGLYFNNKWTSLASVGLKLDGEYTDSVEVEYLEIANGNFAGAQFKKDGRTKEMNGMIFHDSYIHDIHSEGIYWGTTWSGYRHGLGNARIYNNLFVNTGSEIVQFNNQSVNNWMYNNVFVNSATNNLSAFNLYQDNGWQGTYRNGNHKVFNNLFAGMGHQPWNFYLGSHAETQPLSNQDSISIRNNVFYQGHGRTGPVLNYSQNPKDSVKVVIRDNFFGGYTPFKGDQVYMPSNVNSSNSNIMANLIGSLTPNGLLKFVNNKIDGTKPTFYASGITDTVGNFGVDSIEYPRFANSGWPVGFNYSNLKTWADTIFNTWGDENISSTNNVKWMTPVFYQVGDLVLWLSKTYRSKIADNHGNEPAGYTNSYWELITWTDGVTTYTYPPNDYRLIQGSTYQTLGIGLQDSYTPPVPVTAPWRGYKMRFKFKY